MLITETMLKKLILDFEQKSDGSIEITLPNKQVETFLSESEAFDFLKDLLDQ